MRKKGWSVAAVIIGVDPHKGSHTAVAIDGSERQLGRLRVRASMSQAGKLVEWAAAWPERMRAVEGAGGLGQLLAQQLVTAGERVLDIQPKLGSRVRLLSSGSANKNDPNDALSVAVAALRSPRRREVVPEDHQAVLKMRAKRHRDLARLRAQAACRLHALLCGLVPGGIATEITPAQATRILAAAEPAGAAARARHQLAAEHLADLRHLDAQLRDTKTKLAAAVRASGTSLTGIFGIGPVIAATIIGDVEDITRFHSRDKFAAWTGTAPIEVSSGSRVIHRLSLRGNRRLNHAIHMAALTQIRHQHSEGRAYYDKKIAEGKTPKEALRALKRRISNTIYARLRADARRAAAGPAITGPGGQPGNDSASSAAGSHPARQRFGPATPEPSPQPTTPRHRPPPGTSPGRRHQDRRQHHRPDQRLADALNALAPARGDQITPQNNPRWRVTISGHESMRRMRPAAAPRPARRGPPAGVLLARVQAAGLPPPAAARPPAPPAPSAAARPGSQPRTSRRD